MVSSKSRFEAGPRLRKNLRSARTALTGSGGSGGAGFAPQMRLGYHTGDQWEPAIAADGRGHVYVLYPQYGAVPDCGSCNAPSIALIVSSDNGLSWGPSKALLPFSTGQFDPQIVVDPVDRQTVYASWLQNNKRDIIVARSLDFGQSWSFSLAERGSEEADKPVLAVRGADVYVGFNHERRFLCRRIARCGADLQFAQVNPNAAPGSSLAGGATVDPAGNVYFGWTAYSRREMPSRPVERLSSAARPMGDARGATLLLDLSSAPPDCDAARLRDWLPGRANRAGFRRCGRALCGVECRRSERRPRTHLLLVFYDGRRKLVGAGQRIATRRRAWSTAFPAIVAGPSGDVRIAWMDARASESGHRNRPLWNTFYRNSTNGGATWNAEVGCRGRPRATTTFCRAASASPSETTSGLQSIATVRRKRSGARGATISLRVHSGTRADGNNQNPLCDITGSERYGAAESGLTFDSVSSDQT